MSDEEESMSEGFSASEEEWTPNAKAAGGGGGGESSDDDDSDFEDIRKNSSSTAVTNVTTKKRVEVKSRIVQKSTKKRKTVGQTLRAKLYNKYRPPPKTFSPPGSSPSTSKKAPGVPKNSRTPNESNVRRENDSSSDCSINNYLVNPDELDLSSSFFNKPSNEDKDKSHSPPPPIFDCNVGLENQTDSDSDSEAEEKEKKFDFGNLLQNLNNIERTKEEMAKRNVEWTSTSKTPKKDDAMDVYSVLALGEKQQKHSKKEYDEDEDDEEEEEEDENDSKATRSKFTSRSTKLNKSKSTRIKRHVKVRPTSMSVPSDSDDSEWEDVADQQNDSAGVKSSTNNLEIVVALPTRQHCTKTKTQQDMELALKRKFNRDRKEYQLLMHKVSLLCHFGHYYQYNRVLNDLKLMKLAVKLLPSQNAYPTEKGTEVKYYQSLAIWFKTAINLKSTDFTSAQKYSNKKQVKIGLREQIKAKEACCKRDMIYIFVILLRGMGFQCRLVVNMQPIPLKPPTDDLISIKLKTNTDNPKKSNPTKVIKVTENVKFKTPKKMITKKKKKDAEDIKNIAKNATESAKAGNIHKTTAKTENLVIKRKQEAEKNGSKNLVEKKDTQLSKKSGIRTRSQSTETKPQEVNASEKNKKSTKTITKTQLESVEEEPKLGHDSDKNKISKTTTKTIKASAEKLVNLEKLKTNKKLENGTSSLSNTASKRAHLPDISQEPKSKTKPKEFTKKSNTTVKANNQLTASTHSSRSRSKSPNDQITINPEFLQSERLKTKLDSMQPPNKAKLKASNPKKPKEKKVQISATFLTEKHRILRSRVLETNTIEPTKAMPQLDGEDDEIAGNLKEKKRPNLSKLKNQRNKFNEHESDEDFEPSSSKRPKSAPIVTRNNRLALSPDIENDKANASLERKRKTPVHDVWVEVWCDVEQKWICIDLFSGKVDCVESIKKSASGCLAYVYAFQNDLSIKDVTARYCSKWTDTVRKCRVDKDWLDTALNSYMARPTMRDIQEDQELRRLHEEKPMPTAISDYKNHPFYALERHLLKFEALYPPNAPTLGYVRGEPVYSRDCVHTLHSREIWLKQARVVKLGEKPYKIVKARPKWDRITQTLIKDQPLEIFGFWQTQDYEPPTAENGLVPRNAYGNVELFKPTMLPKKTVHLRLPGLNRICKKLGIDCANAVIGFDFHQGVCHPMFDGFVVCEEFGDQVTAAWHQDQEDQERKELEKYEARVYGNWKKLIRGLFIRERLKAKYNF